MMEALLGKLLRIDVDVPDAPYWRVPPDNPNPIAGELGLIWAKGLRNPWRFSFDRANGDLYIGDVGQDTLRRDRRPARRQQRRRELRMGQLRGNARAWPIAAARPNVPDPADDFVFPVLEYGRGDRNLGHRWRGVPRLFATGSARSLLL